MSKLFFSIATLCFLLVLINPMARQAHADPWQTAPTSMTVAGPPRLPSLSSALDHNPFSQPAQASGNTGFMPGVIPLSGPGAPNFGTPMQVPNPGEAVVPGASSAQVQLIGVATGNGKPPMALIQMGSVTQIVAIGNNLGGHIVSQILPQGIVFKDGSRLGISTEIVVGSQAPETLPNTPPFVSPINTPMPSPNPVSTPQVIYRPRTIPLPMTQPSFLPPPTIRPGPLPTM